MLLKLPPWRTEQTWDKLVMECAREMSNLYATWPPAWGESHYSRLPWAGCLSAAVLAMGNISTAPDPHAFTEMFTCSIAEWPDFCKGRGNGWAAPLPSMVRLRKV